MKMKNITKFLAGAGAALMLATTSCVGDLDLIPNDPNSANEVNAASLGNILAKCYSGLAVEGQNGPGSCDIAGIDGGRSQYIRAIYMMNEFPTDEVKWKWKDSGIYDLNTNTFGASNGNIYGTYSRFYSHIAVCNDFIRNANEFGGGTDEYAHMILEARTLRAMSYYWVVDIFGMGSFVTEEDEIGSSPVQLSRVELYNWLAGELEDIVATFKSKYPNETVQYGKVGLDGAQALLARLYLNAEVYTGTPAYDKCQAHCEEIIARHKGGGFQNSGLAKHYLYLFCRSNSEYAPGGGNTAENEILWNVPYDTDETRTYGGTFFMIASSTSSGSGFDPENGKPGEDGIYNMDPLDYGTNASWTCMHATPEFADKFTDGDIRQSMWLKEDAGFIKENTVYSAFNNGYAVIKFTSLIKGTDGDWSAENGGKYDPTGQKPADVLNWSSTDFPFLRLADIYLTYTESYVLGKGTGSSAKAVEYVNYVRNRAGLSSWTANDLTADNILDERCREMYWELTRRSDLIRHNKFTGSNYNWSWKGDSPKGVGIDPRYKLMPIPTNIIAAQPSFKQNPGY